MNAIRVLLADDHTLFRDGLRLLLASVPDIEVVGEAVTGEEVIAQAEALRPDVILMDIKMPGLSGIEATRRILLNRPEMGIVIVTMYEDDSSIFAAMRAGARGYVLKGAKQDELLRAIQAVAAGDTLFGPSVASQVMTFFSSLGTRAPEQLFPELTDREREVLALIAEGYTNAEITERLVVSPKTVRNHISHIFSKLQVADRAQAIMRAREEGLGREK